MLFNLLKNALYYIARARKGQIYIHLENRENENRLYFKDTGKGIAKEMLSHIFNRFYSKTDGGVGIGLSFCKMAMEWMGGSITCQSVEGEYTEFVLHFPIPKE
ncbi:MAG TPA: ATP-binding protein [Coxiellaceae bacterium]|nr:ATP-binding protein [Coxiellaceae bacterium]HBY55608.1 ATP-binding protein [Coxiellaceae bacterium]